MRVTRPRILLLLLMLMVSAPVLADSAWQFNDVDRVVAMSDIHGAFDAMVGTLQNASVIDDALSWTGGATNLVITGDLLDRGPASRQAMDLLMRLEGEARAAGGAVHVLLGNHEAMNLMGDLRYVSNAEYAAFADEETPTEREHWYNAWVERAIPSGNPASRQDFDRKFPRGFFAHRRAFAADGIYGKWLLAKPLIVVINRTAFVHGGLSPMVAKLGLDGVNRQLHADLVTYMRALGELEQAGVLLPTDAAYERQAVLRAHTPAVPPDPALLASITDFLAVADTDLNAADGPLWYRGNVVCGPLIELDRLEASLRAIDADRVVIGHTPTPGREVLKRFDGRVFEIDTGMLANYYGGYGHALVLKGDTVRVVSERSTELLAPAAHPRRVGTRPDGSLSADELEQMLKTGELGASHEDEHGRSVVEVSRDGHSIQAVFDKRAGRNFYPEVAAFRLDRLLQLGMVPVTVMRKVDGRDGSLQFLPAKRLDEQSRATSGQGGAASCALNDQWPAMYVFDSLIYNEGRSPTRMLYSTDSWQLILVGHQQAFSTRKGRPHYLAQVPLVINDAWRAALQSLDQARIDAIFSDVLDSRRRRALLARRDELLTAANQ